MPEMRLPMEWQTGLIHYEPTYNYGWRKGNKLSVDKPCVTIMAAGMGGIGGGMRLVDDGAKARRPLNPNPNKPPYRVPSMSEIAAIPWNGLNAVSTFSGCGGSSLGYKMAGYRVLWASEFIPAAQNTYRANHGNTILDTRDIREVSAQHILDAIGLQKGQLDLLDGSPPCASFSTAGKREATWGKVKTYSDTEQRVDDLFFEFIRILEGLQPKVFVAENVSGLVKGTAKGYFLLILSQMKQAGYKVKCKVLDAQWLGVPQARQRAIFVGVRNDLDAEPTHPAPLNYRYTVRDAMPWITALEGTGNGFGAQSLNAEKPSNTIGAGQQSPWSSYEVAVNTTDYELIVGNKAFAPKWGSPDQQPSPTILASGAHGGSGEVRYIKHEVEPEADITGYATGREYDNLNQGQQSAKYFNLVKASTDLPSPTILASHGSAGIASVVHPIERRKFTIAELRRICGFPDDFILTGTYAQQWERLGRAVPPVMMSHIAATIRDKILCKASP